MGLQLLAGGIMLCHLMNHSDNPEHDSIADEALRLEAALLAMDRPAVAALLRVGGETLTSVERIERLMVPALESIGRAWEAGEVALSQVYLSGRICEELLNATIDPGERPALVHPRMAMAVLEDNHALGKRIVCSVLRAAGYALDEYELGIDAEALVQRVLQDDVKLLLISTLMLRSALRIGKVTAALREARSGTRVLVGGAPFLFDACLWREVGADAMGRNASDAIHIVRSWRQPAAEAS